MHMRKTDAYAKHLHIQLKIGRICETVAEATMKTAVYV